MGKREELLTALVRSPVPLSGDVLGAQLGVSSRTVRSYVSSLNRRAPLINATHRGYSLDRQVHRETTPHIPQAPDSPATRLQFLCRYLAERSEPTSVHDLADLLCISESTLESDLTRARETLREHDLVLRRDHTLIWVDGLERSRRRLVRDALSERTGGLGSSTWRAFCSEYDQMDVRDLGQEVRDAIDSSELEFNEYAIVDVVMHLVIAVARIQQGGTLPAGDSRGVGADPQVTGLREMISRLVEQRSGIVLPPAERDALYRVLAVRGAAPATAEAVIDPLIRAVVAEVLDEISYHYLLGPSDATLLRNLTLHVQHLVARAGTGTDLLHPLGGDFKNAHPVVHDLALAFAGKLEARLGIEVHPSELDYLSFHLGLQYMRCVEGRDLLTVSLVVPRYYDLAERLAARVSAALLGQAVVEHVATSLEFDFTTATSDLIVSCIEPEGPANAPIVVISPFFTTQDTDDLLACVRQERERHARCRVQAALTSLIDPSAFFRVEGVDSQEAALAMMCAALFRGGYVERSFYQDVVGRERRSSTHFGGEFAMPHSMFMDAKETGIAVLVSNTGIPWGESRVRLVFLVALSPNGRETFRTVLEEITRLLASRPAVASLVAGSSDFEAFMTSLSDLIDGEAGPAHGDRTPDPTQ